VATREVFLRLLRFSHQHISTNNPHSPSSLKYSKRRTSGQTWRMEPSNKALDKKVSSHIELQSVHIGTRGVTWHTHSTSVTSSGIRRTSHTGIKSAFPLRKHIPRFPYEMSQSDTHKLPIQKWNMKLSFVKLARRLSKTNRWNLQGSRGEVWRTLPEGGGMKRGNVLLLRPRGYLSTRYFTLQILAPS